MSRWTQRAATFGGLWWLAVLLLLCGGAAVRAESPAWTMDFHLDGGVGCRDLDAAAALPASAWRPQASTPGTRTRVAGRVLWVRLQAQSPPPLPPTRLVVRWEHNARLFDWRDPAAVRLRHEPGHAPGFTVVSLPQAREGPLFLCLQAPAPRVEAFALMSPERLQAEERAVVLWMSLLIGLVLAVSALGLAFYLRLRAPMFGLFAVFSLSLLGFLLGGVGVIQALLPVSLQDSNVDYALTAALAGLSAMACVHFSLPYLRIGEQWPRVARLLRRLALLVLLSTAASLLNVALTVPLAALIVTLVAQNVFVIAIILTLLIAAGLSAWRGQREARSYLLGWMPLMGLVVVWVLVVLGVLPTHLRPSPLWTLGGAALVSLVLAWGLIDQARRDRIERDQATARAGRDPLTGAASRAALMPRLEAASTGTLLLYLDIDHFKSINDQHGHAVGDRCLQRFASRCRAQLRGVDLLARQGGEEFVALLPDIGLQEALRVAERIRVTVAQPAEGEPSYTVSIGVAQRGAGEPVADWVARADAALYRAKAGGRNRIELARAAGLLD
ncbi:MAG: GGDEF domain-containing protein [Xanthomonadales bacterium]|jgi:diguanylate cyclase (GGDEF)-like protein|nr:GGDEF domain-containing protein [Xanthomonadales bacterium]